MLNLERLQGRDKCVQNIDFCKFSPFSPFIHFTCGIGEPTAMQDKFRFAPSITSLMGSGGRENVGGTRRTFTYKFVAFECSVPTEFSATHSYLPWSSSRLFSICRPPKSRQWQRESVVEFWGYKVLGEKFLVFKWFIACSRCYEKVSQKTKFSKVSKNSNKGQKKYLKRFQLSKYYCLILLNHWRYKLVTQWSNFSHIKHH